MLALAGYPVRSGWPRGTDKVLVWGQKPTSRRGRWVARRTGADVLTIEDGFLHSIGSGGQTASLSLVLDDLGIYFDARRPSRLERLLEESDLSEAGCADAARMLDKLKRARLSKYTPAVVPRTLGEGHVIVVDQTAGDASIAGAGADAARFTAMLNAARTENPGRRIVIKAHPEVVAGRKRGHFGPGSLAPDEELLATPINPWDALLGAHAVYTVSSQLGYEALLAGVRVRCFGQAFYAGWGLTEDEVPCPRRTRRRSLIELFSACHIAYPIYYDPWRDALTSLDTAIDVLQCRRDSELSGAGTDGDVFAGVRLWKRRNLAQFQPARRLGPRFQGDLDQAARTARQENRHLWCWGSKFSTANVPRLAAEGLSVGMVEDGFLRSVGLGAELTQAASLVFDRSGIYFDPSVPSDLEGWIANAASGGADEDRAARLRKTILDGRVTKYNLRGPELPRPPPGRRVVLVPGQVEDDASILRGCGKTRTNLGLLRAARAGNPDAWLIYKPHPDVEAGLRAGSVSEADARALADHVAGQGSPADLLDLADSVWTMTSLMGFEALLRGKPVTCLGTPFYAGWGLTEDLGPACSRRIARPTLDQLVWATLIAYPSYVDPASGLPCPPELVVERLAAGVPGRRAGLLSKLQGLLASQSWLWRG